MQSFLQTDPATESASASTPISQGKEGLGLRAGTEFYVTDGNIMYLTDASRFLISCVIQHYAPVVGWGGWRNRCIMLIMTLDPSWRQTLRLPPPGVEPGRLRHRRALNLKSYQDSLYQSCGCGIFIPDPGS